MNSDTGLARADSLIPSAILLLSSVEGGFADDRTQWMLEDLRIRN
jgi:hypothetical protein